ncbi:MAG: GDP-mannose-dependent alpha-(1-2)-phosphatidylinositol mannosyltransferase [Actinomycetia bacterium]|nr:GDP-mannose-dependent alpha-(1-2)-phosphatidylinositol mannosyltransferase [Actinomycetes bacterium]
MRIALVCPYDWQAAGGVQVHVASLAAQLRERGHEAVVVAPTSAVPAEPRVRSVGRPVRVSYRGTVAPIAPLAYLRTRAVLAEVRPDLVHVHEPLTPSASMYATLASRAPVVATVHAYLDRSRAMELAAPVLRRVWARVSIGVAVSHAAAAFLRRALPEVELEIVPNGVDVKAFADAEPRADLPPGRRIAWAHRLDPQKGFFVAVAAFAKVLAEIPDAVLLVAGDGRDREALRLLTPAARERVHMLGAVANERLPAIHAVCDAFVAPAVGQESFGVSVVEAMAAGLPVVASDIPGYREVVTDGVEGLLVPPRDPEAVAAGLVRILRDPQLAARLGAAGRERARTFDWPTVVDRLEEVYGRAIEGAGYDRSR